MPLVLNLPAGLTGVEATVKAVLYRQTTEGWWMKAVDMTSGLGIIERDGDSWKGAADPRREGVALGD